MKVLWLCNIMLPVIARQLHMEASNKEGWISGLADAVLEHRQENDIVLSMAFPVGKDFLREAERNAGMGNKVSLGENVFKTVLTVKNRELVCYGFYEDVSHAETYDASLEESMIRIVGDAAPDIVHCFGTEYPHTLAMCRTFPRKDRLLAGLQGLCTLCAKAYYANLPEKIIRSATLRDCLRRDSLVRQQEKFAKRGEMEREIMGLAGNITGRTRWDREFAAEQNPHGRYFHMNEILRPEFYGSVWEEARCIPHSIFVSQGDYPLKGLHYVLEALPDILAQYPDAKVYVAGNSIVRAGSLKEKLKLSAYGKYLRRLIQQNGLEERVTFLGKLSAQQMRDRYLVSHLYLCPSSLENSPNSLGEAMLLGMPCVSADVGGISSLFTGGRDGILYEGFQMKESEGRSEMPHDEIRVKENEGRSEMPHDEIRVKENEGRSEMTYDDARMKESEGNDKERDRISRCLAEAVIRMWSSPGKMREYCKNAAEHARDTHDRDKNYRRLTEIYQAIYGGARKEAI